jgi:hypothetical protein
MQFTGHAAPKEASPAVLKATTTAPSCSLTSTTGPAGVLGTLQYVPGEKTVLRHRRLGDAGGASGQYPSHLRDDR